MKTSGCEKTFVSRLDRPGGEAGSPREEPFVNVFSDVVKKVPSKPCTEHPNTKVTLGEKNDTNTPSSLATYAVSSCQALG